GNSLERDSFRVLSDVQNGYVSEEKAKELYGVVIEKRNGDLAIHEPLTRKAREISALAAQKKNGD
ncbi:MAG: hypothetical protein AAB279_01465, partial [Candidatus Binatota bacterium]